MSTPNHAKMARLRASDVSATKAVAAVQALTGARPVVSDLDGGAAGQTPFGEEAQMGASDARQTPFRSRARVSASRPVADEAAHEGADKAANECADEAADEGADESADEAANDGADQAADEGMDVGNAARATAGVAEQALIGVRALRRCGAVADGRHERWSTAHSDTWKLA
eukprot:gene1995-4943_t